MKLAGLGKLYTMLYDDRMDIYRTDSGVNDDETTDIFYPPQPKYTDIRCRLSFSSSDTGADSDVDREPIKYNPTVFCEPSVDIKAGDYITIRRYTDNGSLRATYSGRASQPSWYSTHQEVHIGIDEGA